MTVGEYAFEVSPPFHHPGQQFRPSRIEGRVKLQGHAQGSWRRHGMSLGRSESRPIVEAFVKGSVMPAKDFERIQVVTSREHTAIFNVRQPADVQNEVRAPSLRGQSVASSLATKLGPRAG